MHNDQENNIDNAQNKPSIWLNFVSALFPVVSTALTIVLTFALRYSEIHDLVPPVLLLTFPLLALVGCIIAVIVRIKNPSLKIKSAALCFLMSWLLIFALVTLPWGPFIVCFLYLGLDVLECRTSTSEKIRQDDEKPQRV